MYSSHLTCRGHRAGPVLLPGARFMRFAQAVDYDESLQSLPGMKRSFFACASFL